MKNARVAVSISVLIVLLSISACGSPDPTAPAGGEARATGGGGEAAGASLPDGSPTTEPDTGTTVTATPEPSRTPTVTSAEPATGAPSPSPTTETATETATEAAQPTPTATVRVVDTPTPSAPNVNVAFILDASGSMLEAMGSRTRLAVAQDAITDLTAGLPQEMNASLWLYGHRVDPDDKAASCLDIEEVILLDPVDAGRFDTVAHSFGAKGYTPVTESIQQAAESLPVGVDERNAIVLVSDGEETCDGDPCAMSAAVKAAAARVTVHAIGLNANKATRAQLKCVAEASGGTYRDAGSAGELGLALEEAAGAVADEASGVLRDLGRPSSVALSPDGEHVYVTNPGPDTLVAFERDPASGTLSVIEVHRQKVGGVDGLNRAFAAEVSSDGKNVYVASIHGAVAVFGRDPDTGWLSFVEAHQEGIDGVQGLAGATDLAVSPDGKSVYVVGSESDALVVFDRNPDSGELTFVEALVDGIGGVEGLDAVLAVTVSPDNEQVFTASNPSTKDDALVVFERDPGTGKLTFGEAIRDGIDGVDGLQGGASVAISPDGRFVYVVGRIDEALAIFSRDPGTGALTFVAAHEGDIRGKPRSAAISPDGRHLYVVTDQADTILAFERDNATGALTFVGMHTDGEGGVDGLEWANWVTVSPDGKHVYVAGFDDPAVAVFERDPTTGMLSFLEAIRNAAE